MKILKHLPCLLLLTALSGCISEFNANLPASDEDILIVEGDIVANTNSEFSLSKSFPLSVDQLPADYNNITATVVLTGSDGYRSEPASKVSAGKYQIAVGELKSDVAYGIEIEYNGAKYSSVPATPLVTPSIDNLTWKQPIPKEAVAIHLSTQGDPDKFQYYMWNYIEDWEITADYYTHCFYNPTTGQIYQERPNPVYYCWKKYSSQKILIATTESQRENRITNHPLYKIDPSNDRMSVLYSVLVKQRALSKEAYNYYQNLQKQNESMGGLFTPQPSEVQGNIRCNTDPSRKVIGFVGVLKNITEKRIFITSAEITRPFIYRTCREYDDDFFSEMQISSFADRYSAGFAPVGMDAIEFWTQLKCVDCQADGGSKKKPAFWPNDHQ